MISEKEYFNLIRKSAVINPPPYLSGTILSSCGLSMKKADNFFSLISYSMACTIIAFVIITIMLYQTPPVQKDYENIASNSKLLVNQMADGIIGLVAQPVK